MQNENDKLYYNTSQVFWTNTSEEKPDPGHYATIEWTYDGMQNIKLNTDSYGIAEVVSTISNISLFKFRGDVWLVNEVIPLNNNTYKYNINIDIWSTLTLPFLYSQSDVVMTRSHINQYYNPVFEDTKIDDLPLIYKKYKNVYPDIGTIGTANTTAFTNGYVGPDGLTEYQYFQNMTIFSSIGVNDLGSIYFVFDKNATFNGEFQNVNFKITKLLGKTPNIEKVIITDPYVIIPVITSGKAFSNTTLNPSATFDLINNFTALTLLSQNVSDEKQFIGVFKGPPLKYKTELSAQEDNNNQNTFISQNFNYCIKRLGKTTNLKAILFTFGGYSKFAKLKLPLWDENNLKWPKYNNIQLEGTMWDNKVYHNGEDLTIIFNGSGFIGYTENTINPDIMNTIISYGSYLVSSTNTYNTYLNSNKSRQNAGIKNSQTNLLGSTIGAIAGVKNMRRLQATTGTYGAGRLATSESIGAVHVLQGMVGVINAKRTLSATKEDLKRTQNQEMQTSDINDNINAIINTSIDANDPKITNFSYKYRLQELSSYSRELIEEMYRLYGWPSQGMTEIQNLIYAKLGYSYFELDIDITKSQLGSYPVNITKQNLILSQLEHGIRIKVVERTKKRIEEGKKWVLQRK